MAVVGVDLGGTKALAGLADGPARARVEVRGLALDGVFEALEAAVREVHAAPDAVGIGIPALVDSATGVAGACVHLPLAGVDVGAEMRRRLGVPVVVDNDANCAALAEARRGAARDARVALLLTIGTGIGGGMVVGGEVFRGASGAAPEFGHMTVALDGPRCACGSRGCLEALVSGPALAVAAGALSGEEAAARALAGDAAALAAVSEMGRALGAGIASLVNALDPDVVVIGGGVMGLGELLLEPARREAQARALLPGRVVVRAAELGPEAGMLGAAMLAEAIA